MLAIYTHKTNKFRRLVLSEGYYAPLHTIDNRKCIGTKIVEFIAVRRCTELLKMF